MVCVLSLSLIVWAIFINTGRYDKAAYFYTISKLTECGSLTFSAYSQNPNSMLSLTT